MALRPRSLATIPQLLAFWGLLHSRGDFHLDFDRGLLMFFRHSRRLWIVPLGFDQKLARISGKMGAFFEIVWLARFLRVAPKAEIRQTKKNVLVRGLFPPRPKVRKNIKLNIAARFLVDKMSIFVVALKHSSAGIGIQ